MSKRWITGALGALAIAACGISAANAGTYVVLANKNALPNGLSKKIEAAGGRVVANLPEIGVAIVDADAENFAADVGKVPGIRSVTEDFKMQWIHQLRDAHAVSIKEATANPPFSGNDDFFYDLQWGLDAVNAPEAWDMGDRGAGVRVAVLDTGFDLYHPDLQQNIDYADSRSFVPGEGLQYALPDPFSHGTHVSGIIAAADNGFGTIGVAPEAQLLLVKVLSDAGSGSFSSMIQGIVYAAQKHADVINMSLGASVPHNVHGAAELMVAMGRATNYAYQHGVTIIAAAGNDGADMDHDASTKFLPAELPHVLAISATGPVGWGANPNTNLDVTPSYTNYGQSAIAFAAPGGNFDSAYQGYTGPCTVDGLTEPCYVFDFVFSDGNQGWFWAVGTSMASPHAAGVAALIISRNGGHMDPAQVEAAMAHGADDLGKPGNDDFYGAGRVNALNSIQ